MEDKKLSMELAGRELSISDGPIKTFASGYAILTYGETVIMCNATINDSKREGMNFFPLTCEFQDHMFAVGRIKGSRFIKRSGRPSEKSILTARLIDRPIRPLFPKKMRNEVQVVCSTLSSDGLIDPGPTAINAASIALMLSGGPFEGPVAAVRIGYFNDQIIVNPTIAECEEGKLDLVVAGTKDAITMVEAGAKEVSEEVIVQAFEAAHKEIIRICEFQEKYVSQFVVKKMEFEFAEMSSEWTDKVKSIISKEDLDTICSNKKKEITSMIKSFEDKIFEHFATEIENNEISKGDLADIFMKLFETNMRENIFTKEYRLDGRKLDEVRPITVNLDLFPRTHGSAMFKRGETSSYTIATLGGPADAQLLDTMLEKDIKKRYFHHYTFPPFSTGEVKPMRGPGRREIGHGDLAERALIPVLPDSEEFPYTIWTNTEILTSNGSTSMASVCGSTLSLMAAGVPLKKPVAGIAMGLISNEATGDYKVLTDIQAAEDFAGDMDFKVTGTEDGITALQMDIKIKGLTMEIMRNALSKAKAGRAHIMGEMLKVLPENRAELSQYAPIITSVMIKEDQIGLVIGKGGETIKLITEECDVEIDIEDSGQVNITAPNSIAADKAIKMIKEITYVPKAGESFTGKVVKVLEFGAIVQMNRNFEGMVHISEWDNKRTEKMEDVVKVGDMVKVQVLEIAQGRMKLSRKRLL